MAIKTTIQGLINSLIRTNPTLIDKTEHADVEDALLLNSYGDVVNEKAASVTNVITGKNTINTDLLYNINIVKQGRVVTIIGNIQNTSSLIVSDVDTDNFFFEIINPDYFPNTTAALNKYPTYDGAYIKMGGTDRKFVYCSSIGASTTIDFSITYFTQD